MWDASGVIQLVIFSWKIVFALQTGICYHFITVIICSENIFTAYFTLRYSSSYLPTVANESVVSKNIK